MFRKSLLWPSSWIEQLNASAFGSTWVYRFPTNLKVLHTPYSPMENVLVMTIAASMGGMPVTAGLDGIIPALEYFITPKDKGPMKFPLWHIILWSSSVCLFGIVFAAPLRYYFVIRDPLRFPTGTAMATVIALLHGRPDTTERISQDQSQEKAIHVTKRGDPSPDTEEQREIPSGDGKIVQVYDEGHNNTGEDMPREKVIKSTSKTD